ncbi:MAG: Nif3-like dinuclear metal center hexameric protein [Verrucomicrobiae bacterium]|nr:Nif3-like dinuclear metal center hexameric protein [Verrucomicrobiae bacterium]NNJ44331.1 Nif3-like dinuclear metal center hexameric protein [Akkermansiaceae bacterium]
MTSLQDLKGFLDQELNISGIPDYPGALNGLQIENGGEVTKIAAAVDASSPVFEKAIAAGADLLLVHHGMFWQGSQPVTGPVYKKLKMALDAGLALYSAHIPLDVHAQWGNNIQLATQLGMHATEPFFDWKGIQLGLSQDLDIDRSELHAQLAEIVAGPVHLCPGGPRQVGKVGIVTGGAGSEVAAMAECGIQTFITGEGPHWSYPLAEELGINVLYAGHYATETFGVRALCAEMGRKFGLETLWLDHPTGM